MTDVEKEGKDFARYKTADYSIFRSNFCSILYFVEQKINLTGRTLDIL